MSCRPKAPTMTNAWRASEPAAFTNYPPPRGEGREGARHVCAAKDSASLNMKRLSLHPDAITRARRLRRDMTSQERKLWRALREVFPDIHFRKQVPLGPYFADFACHKAKLVGEVDGGQHGSAASQVRDAERTAYLASEGYRVLRFWNIEVDDNMDGVLAAIANALPLVGRVGVGAARVCAPQETFTPIATISCAADAARPHPNPPHKGEGILASLVTGVR